MVADEVSQSGSDKIQKTSCKVPISVIRNTSRKGIGYAIKQGLQYALDKKNTVSLLFWRVTIEDDPTEIPRLLGPLLKEDCDYIQGSRFLQGGKRVNNPHIRGVFSRFYPFLWTLLTNVRCTDVTNGFRAYKLELLEDPRINIWQSC